jgi:uncharacterized protein
MPRPVHFEIHASQPQEIQAFYSALFGWTFHQWGEQDYWLLATGDGNPMAGIPSSKPGIDGALVPRSGPVAEEGQPVNSWVVTVDVDDARAYLDRAVALGATVAVPLAPIPGVGWLAYIKDPDGNILGMMQSDPDAGPASPAEP